jgi:PAS domain S-box-containing protein
MTNPQQGSAHQGHGHEASLDGSQAPASRQPPKEESRADELEILKVIDAVLGVSTIAFAVYGTCSALLGRTAPMTALTLWAFPVFNLALSRLGRHMATAQREIVRCVVSIPMIMHLYATKGGDFDHFSFPALAVVVGHSALWGCLTSRPVVGHALAFTFGSCIVVSGWLGSGAMSWLAIRSAVGVTMTGLVVSVVSARLGKSLREARARRDEAESHKQRLESTVDELASTQQRLDAVLRCAPGFIVAVDRAGNVELANRKTPPFGANDATATNLLEQVGPEQRERLAERIDAVFETGQQQTFEFRDVSRDGTERWFAATLGARQSDEQIGGVVVITQDVTELKRSQAAVVATQRMAAVGTLAAGIAHEINTPIQFVGDTTAFLRTATRDLLNVVAKPWRRQY